MDPKINRLYNEYREGKLDRRTFMKKLAMIVGGTAAAYNILPLLDSNSATAATPWPGPELETDMISYPGKTGDVIAFMARPKDKKKLPAVIVIHENKALQPHIKDVTRRMAAEGFLAIAPDALSPLGGTPESEDEARTMMRDLNMDDTTADFVAAVKYLDTHPLTSGKVGCTGFCWGGAMTNRVAVNAPDLDAAVPYYGTTPDQADVPRIKASVMAHYAGEDARINEGIPAFEEALKKAGIEYQLFVYEGAQHAFNNDSNPDRYNEEAAKLAWKRTVDFFKKKLV